MEREVLDAGEVRLVIQNIPLEDKKKVVTKEKATSSNSEDSETKQSLSPTVSSIVDKQQEKSAPA